MDLCDPVLKCCHGRYTVFVNIGLGIFLIKSIEDLYEYIRSNSGVFVTGSTDSKGSRVLTALGASNFCREAGI